jgi:hypothetical protein
MEDPRTTKNILEEILKDLNRMTPEELSPPAFLNFLNILSHFLTS